MSERKTFEKGLALYSKGKFEEALIHFESLTDPSFEIMKHYHIGLVKIQMGLLEDGLKEYRKIHEVNRVNQGVEYDKFMFSLYINMGSTLQVLAKKKGKELYNEAISCYNYALQIEDDDARVWNNLGNAYLEIEKYLDAIKSFRKAIELDDEYPEAHYSISLVYESMGNFEKAIEHLETALKWKSQNKIILNRLAGLCFGTGDFSKAKRYLALILSNDPKDPASNKNMALILYNMEQYEEAYPYYQIFLDSDPDFQDPEVQGIFDDLKNKVNKQINNLK
ncbi:tetratricopeptide repeat protein [Promethearchaeum syntrophicum]|uniref:Tetratricopeptide repeat protein n=1 Tax=Promethearchaeum syntrophicum TaxID=2594042 RepID=A0A5B9DAS3_9ARCH